MTREELVTRHVDLVEQAMRGFGMWSPHPPPAGVKELKAPFGMDVLTLDQWLQYVFVPNVREACKSVSLPESSEVGQQAFREWCMHGEGPDGVEKLVDLLYELDDLVTFHPTIKRIGFFETEKPARSHWGRELANRFRAADVRYIAWQLELDHAERSRPLEIVLEWKYVRDTVLWKAERRTILDPSWTDSWHMESYGFDARGRWPAGDYRLDVLLWDREFATATFTLEP